MFSKISPRKILSDHFKTLRKDGTEETNRNDLILFFVLPGAIAIICLSGLNLRLMDGTISILATSLSIFAALLFNLLLLVYDVVRQERVGAEVNKLRDRALTEIFANISFSILVAILAVVLLLVDYLLIEVLKSHDLIEYVLNFVIYWLTGLFILTLFMVLKRIHILLSKEFD